VSAYGLLDDAARVASGGAVGRYVDTNERRAAACRLYALQHACVAVSCAAAAAALACTGPGRAVLACVVVASGAFAGVGASGSSLSVEREWTKALHADDAAALTTLNARMRAVDLSCLLLAPIAAAGLLQLAGPPVAVLCFAVYNAVVYWPECRLLSAAQAASPALQQPRAPAPAPAGTAATASVSATAGLRGTWAVYARQPVFPAAVALALLYLTVLSLGFLMTAYLHWCGVHDVVIAIFRAVGAATGLSATAAFPPAARATRLPVIAAAAVAFQLLWLLIGVLPVSFSSGSASLPAPPLLRLLMASIAISRAGLWMADLAVSQLLQDGVSAAELGTVNGVQSSLCAALEMLGFIAGLLVHNYARFRFLMLGSCVSVAASAIMLARYAAATRGAAASGEAEAEQLLALEEEQSLLRLEPAAAA
jgi:iron-regulated transporter 1